MMASWIRLGSPLHGEGIDTLFGYAVRLVLEPGPSAYSDLASLPDGTILCFYERGEKDPYEKLTLARIPATVLLSEAP